MILLFFFSFQPNILLSVTFQSDKILFSTITKHSYQPIMVIGMQYSGRPIVDNGLKHWLSKLNPISSTKQTPGFEKSPIGMNLTFGVLWEESVEDVWLNDNMQYSCLFFLMIWEFRWPPKPCLVLNCFEPLRHEYTLLGHNSGVGFCSFDDIVKNAVIQLEFQ